MNEKHNIDRLFQEKFKDFEEAPPEFVWENIEEVLREKKKRRVIPLWIRLSGAAAIFIIGTVFSVSYFDNTGTDSNKNPVVIDNNGTKRIQPTDNPIPNKGTIIVDSTTINGMQNSAVASGDEQERISNEAASGHNPAKNRRRSNSSFNNTADAVADGAGAATPSNRHKKANGAKRTTFTSGYTTEAIAYDKNIQKNTSGRNTTIINEDAIGQNVSGIPANDGNAIAAGSAKAPALKDNLQNSAAPGNTGQETDIIKKDIPVEQAIAEAPVDTASVLAPENPLEKLLQEQLKDKEEEAVAENSNRDKWNIKPQVAPVFYNSLSQGSPIDGQFANNSKSYDNDLSYGVGITYALNDRLTVRSGVNTLNLSYATNDVQFHPSLNGHTNNVAARTKPANIVVQDVGQTTGTGPLGPDSPISLTAMSGFSSQAFEGSMIQTTGYIEVPVEMSYALLNKKFGIDVIGGVSTLFLNENNVSVVSAQGYSAEVGEAQNLNSVHFSTNVGIGFKYRFWKSFQANFEPTFKYQVNAYSRDAGSFKPYFIGLYSGISFSF